MKNWIRHLLHRRLYHPMRLLTCCFLSIRLSLPHLRLPRLHRLRCHQCSFLPETLRRSSSQAGTPQEVGLRETQRYGG